MDNKQNKKMKKGPNIISKSLFLIPNIKLPSGPGQISLFVSEMTAHLIAHREHPGLVYRGTKVNKTYTPSSTRNSYSIGEDIKNRRLQW